MGKICSFPLHISRVVLLLLRQRRGRGNDLGITTKYLRKTTSGAAGIGLGSTIKYPRRTTGAAAGKVGTTLNYLRGAAGNGRAQQRSTFDAQRAPPRETAWAPR
jgi:hypothetical protein